MGYMRWQAGNGAIDFHLKIIQSTPVVALPLYGSDILHLTHNFTGLSFQAQFPFEAETGSQA